MKKIIKNKNVKKGEKGKKGGAHQIENKDFIIGMVCVHLPLPILFFYFPKN